MEVLKMELPKPTSIKDLITLLENRKERYKEDFEVCEKALKNLKDTKQIAYWERERDSIKDRIEEIERKIALYKTIAT
jgi:hypothetical protein